MPASRLFALLALLVAATGCTLGEIANANIVRDGGQAFADSGAFAAAAVPGAFALLELFTSEGCSSTPPAEAAVNRLVNGALVADRRVFALAYHVPYWDYLGWADGYAQTTNTERQWAYARALGHPNIYTPQVVLDGAGDLPWGSGVEAGRAIAASLARPARATVTLVAVRQPGSVQVRFTVTGAPTGGRLNLALAERGLVAHPTRGENAGATLPHAPVVRTFTDVAAGHGEVTLAAPAGLNFDHAEVIGFVQDPRTMAIAGVGRATF